MFIVTGASSGIGRGVAAALAERGTEVLVVARRGNKLAELKERFEPLIQSLEADLSTETGINSLVTAARSADRIDGIVHAAGSLIQPAHYRSLRTDELTAHFRLHVAVPIEINNRLGELLHRRRIVFIDSYSASAPRLGWAGYSIIKSAAQMAARSAEAELPDAHVIRIFPGGVRTELVEAMLKSPLQSPTKDVFVEMEEAGTLVEPDVVGTSIAAVALDASPDELDGQEFWDLTDPTATSEIPYRDS